MKREIDLIPLSPLPDGEAFAKVARYFNRLALSAFLIPSKGSHIMKLLFCTVCQDVVKLTRDKRSCACGASSGYYKPDGLNAVIRGDAILLGFDNRSFATALRDRPQSGKGATFIAFVIPVECNTVTEEG